MRCNKMIIGLLSLGLILLGLFAGTFREAPEAALPGEISFRIGSGENAEQIRCWENNENTVYVFLPGYADLSNVKMQTSGDSTFLIDEVEVADGDSCAGYSLDQSYSLVTQQGNRQVQKELVFVKTGQMPVLYIDVRSGNMDYIHHEKGNEETGSMRLYDDTGKLLCSDALQKIKGRGNTTWFADKKPYNLVLSTEKNLLGLGKAQRWILLAEGFTDSINIRNKIVYDFAASAGLAYSPECRWVELYLNGEYAGLYLLSERNEVHENRVDISGDGHFLVSLEFKYRLQEAGHPYICTDTGQTLRIHSMQLNNWELDSIWQSVENALTSENGIDPVSGKSWKDLIDMDSWARKYLLEEMFGNGDGGSLSQFFYRRGNDPEGKIYAGPVWDYDMAMGGYDVWLKHYTNYFVMDRLEKEKGYGNPWFQSLYRKPEFRSLVEELYETEFLPLMERLQSEGLDAYYEYAEDAHRSDGIRWGTDESAIEYEKEYIRNFLTDRTAFLSEIWMDHVPYHVVRVDTGRAWIYGYFAVKPGECLPELPSYEEAGGIGWFDAETDEPFDVTQPIWEDAEIYVKVQSFQIPKVHYAPVIGMTAIFVGLVVVSIYRTRKNRRRENEPAETG